MGTLDLHGFTKSEAISRTTDFLDRSSRSLNSENAWVLIITGSGAHSSQGPVLRSVIEALLRKRKIEYRIMKGKGSFLVNSASGIVLYEPAQPRDSKVIIAPTSTLTDASGLDFIRRSTLERQLSENRDGSRKALKKEFYNIRNEEAAYDKAISKSLEEKAREKDEVKELLDKAVDLSLAEKQREIDEEKKLSKVIEISKRESIVNEMDEDEQIQKMLALSKAEYDQQNDPDIYLQQVLELSQNERNESFVRNHGEDPEDELLKVLELSVVDF